MNIIRAPWTERQVNNLRERQGSEALHPYTCEEHSWAPLLPRVEGWVCLVKDCIYMQDWATELDTDYYRWWEDVGSYWDDPDLLDNVE